MNKKKEIMEIDGGVVEVDETKWVYDSSMDHKGELPLRASTGSWKASFFIIGKNIIPTSLKFTFLLYFFALAKFYFLKSLSVTIYAYFFPVKQYLSTRFL